LMEFGYVPGSSRLCVWSLPRSVRISRKWLMCSQGTSSPNNLPEALNCFVAFGRSVAGEKRGTPCAVMRRESSHSLLRDCGSARVGLFGLDSHKCQGAFIKRPHLCVFQLQAASPIAKKTAAWWPLLSFDGAHLAAYVSWKRSGLGCVNAR
jgi:hypothetical protein